MSRGEAALTSPETGRKNWTEGYYHRPRADHELLEKYHEGLIVTSACVGGEVPQAILNGDMDEARKVIEFYINTFGKDNYFLEIQNHGLPEEAAVRPVLASLAKEYGLGLVATIIRKRKMQEARKSSFAFPRERRWMIRIISILPMMNSTARAGMRCAPF